ncbi:MAG TPA: HAMP domain-containing sensor histidine kinase [Rhodothermales bacterium]|nr:HAMP domain-containing sensor histidine kinase [Rhodothermales bacterium]
MPRWRALFAPLLPRRASTQTWMMLTFALFVGAAVVGVGFYAFVVLSAQVREAARETLQRQAQRVVALLDAQPEAAALIALDAGFGGMQNLELTVAHVAAGERRVVDAWGPHAVDDPAVFFRQPEVAEALASPAGYGYAERQRQGDEPGSDEVLYVVLSSSERGYIVRLGEPTPPLYRVVQRMQATLVVGMGLALACALLGAWIAARQVVRPLTAITESARRVNEGDLDHTIRVKTRAAEFQDLARSLNRMATRFRADIQELQRMHRVQNEFIGNVSHEVKNPIFAVSGFMEALGSDRLPPEQRASYSQKGMANLNRLNLLFSDLIEIAKLEYRDDLIRPERFDLQGLLAEVVETVRPKADAKGLELFWENPPLDVHADRNRIRQVLTNLVENAVNYSEEGSVRVRMRRHRDKARVEVVDTGRGIAEEHIDRVFERFYRIDSARSRKMGGTGLGLAIVKQILEAHGETIYLESTLGRGSRFWFELPLAETTAPPAGDGAATAPAAPIAR